MCTAWAWGCIGGTRVLVYSLYINWFSRNMQYTADGIPKELRKSAAADTKSNVFKLLFVGRN